MESPDYCHNPTFYNPQSTPEKHTKSSAVDHFIIDDLLDFSHEDEETILPDAPDGTVTGNSTDSSNLTVVDSCNSPFSGSDPPFSANFPDSQLSSELCVPFDDIAELEWLSNFVEESFSTDDLQKMQLISGVKPKQTNETTVPKPSRDNSIFRPDMMSVPGKARSKRNRSSTCNWSSRLLALSSPTTSSSETDVPLKKSFKATPKKKEFAENSDGRKCLHCSTDKTPQWRTGPMGPKTLCNACGVRYKSGRLVPEYRPAASPTFMLTRHSNSHRKVLELRRQKEMHMSQQFLYPHGLFDVPGADCDDFLIHHQTGQDYRQLI